jgi:hypothetical protein
MNQSLPFIYTKHDPWTSPVPSSTQKMIHEPAPFSSSTQKMIHGPVPSLHLHKKLSMNQPYPFKHTKKWSMNQPCPFTYTNKLSMKQPCPFAYKKKDPWTSPIPLNTQKMIQESTVPLSIQKWSIIGMNQSHPFSYTNNDIHVWTFLYLHKMLSRNKLYLSLH